MNQCLVIHVSQFHGRSKICLSFLLPPPSVLPAEAGKCIQTAQPNTTFPPRDSFCEFTYLVMHLQLLQLTTTIHPCHALMSRRSRHFDPTIRRRQRHPLRPPAPLCAIRTAHIRRAPPTALSRSAAPSKGPPAARRRQANKS
jgi:hypothetical protein